MHTNPEVLALVALGEQVATPGEHDHISTCPACSEEVAELARIADVGRSSNTSDSLSAPSPEVWQRIQAELGFDLQAGPSQPAPVIDLAARREASGAVGTARQASSGRRFLALAVAAALALIVGVGIGVAYERQVNAPRERVIASAKLAPLPEWEGASGTAEVTADGRGGRELIVKMTSPKPVDGTVQVWLMDEQGRPTSMGTMDDGVAELVVPPGMSLFDQPTIDISAEPPGDNDPGHNGASILRGRLV